MDPCISIVIPCCNAERYIAAALRSVLGQTFNMQNAEVIVVDDGSTDRSLAVAREILSESGVRHTVLTQMKSGPSHARNVGAQASSGAWIQFLDADDWLHPDKLSTQLKSVFDTRVHCDVVYSPWQRAFDKETLIEEVFDPLLSAPIPLSLIVEGGFLQVGSYIVRREKFLAIGGFCRDRYLIEDVEMLLRLAMAEGEFRKASSGKPLMFYRQVNDSASRRDPAENVRAMFWNTRMVEQWLAEQNQLHSENKNHLAQIYFGFARYFVGKDARQFDEITRRIEALGSDLLPEQPWKLRALSKLLGFRAAAKLAAKLKTARSLLGFK